MSLFLATLLPGLVLLLLGGLLIWNGKPVTAVARAFPRSRRAAWICMGLATVWTLYRVIHLGEADFGNYRRLIFVGFAALAVLTFLYARDFLAVRGACALFLLIADALLSAAYMHFEHPGRLFMVTLTYIGIVIALYLAVSPFRLRDFFNWLFAREIRSRILGGSFAVYGLILVVVALSY